MSINKNKPVLALKIKALTVGRSFLVKTVAEREAVCRAAKSLRDAKVINFDIVTKQQDDGTFKVAAI
jgi:hypothetical protein